MSQTDREFDVVLWGATGYTGSLVAEYLARAESSIRWALAGRSQAKLEELRSRIGANVPLVIGESHDESSMAAMARRARVVCATVGPYTKHGSEVVAACASAGTSYCDITGEPQWIRRMIDEHEDTAKRTGARIVHCCGFDSIPSDLGTWTLQERAITERGSPCASVRCLVTEMRGKTSGGTIASMHAVVEDAARDSAVRRMLTDPYALNPANERGGPDSLEPLTPRIDHDFGWTAPFIMASINGRIVRRTNALTGYLYGRQFRYNEAMATGSGAKGFAAAVAVSAIVSGAMLSFGAPPLRRLAARFMPKPGEGPTAEEREKGRFRLDFIGARADGGPVRGHVSFRKDPGYGGTSVMLAESALCLATDSDKLGVAGGSFTPASAMGSHLVERLRRAGMTFEASA